MAAINVQAREFVNFLVKGYDDKCHDKVEKKIADVFNPPGIVKRVKEKALKSFSDKFSQEGLRSNLEDSNALVVAQYTEVSPTLSHLITYTSMLEAPLLDSKLEQARERIIDTLAQEHLQKKKYELDPFTSFNHGNAAMLGSVVGKPASAPQFANGKRHFYSQIFQEIYGQCTVVSKRKIIARLESFKPLLQTRSFWYQRVVFKIEGTFNRIITNDYVKVGVCVAIGAGFYYLTTLKLIPLAVYYFNSFVFSAMNSGVTSYMPDVVVQIASGAYTRIIAVVAYIADTRIYLFLSSLGKLGAFVGSPALNFIGHKLWPKSKIAAEMGSYVFTPIFTTAKKVGFFVYERVFGPDIRAQMGISKALQVQVSQGKCTSEEAKQLLDDGMKAYQVWMYLMEQGPQEGLFQPA